MLYGEMDKIANKNGKAHKGAMQFNNRGGTLRLKLKRKTN